MKHWIASIARKISNRTSQLNEVCDFDSDIFNQKIRKGILIVGDSASNTEELLYHLMKLSNKTGRDLVHINLNRTKFSAMTLVNSLGYDRNKVSALVIDGENGINGIFIDSANDDIENLFLVPKIPSNSEWDDELRSQVETIISDARTRWPDRVIVISHIPPGFNLPGHSENTIVSSEWPIEELSSEMVSKFGTILTVDDKVDGQFKDESGQEYLIPGKFINTDGKEYPFPYASTPAFTPEKILIQKALERINQKSFYENRHEGRDALLEALVMWVRSHYPNDGIIRTIFPLVTAKDIYEIYQASGKEEMSDDIELRELINYAELGDYIRNKIEDFATLYKLDPSFLQSPTYEENANWKKVVGWVQHSLIPIRNEV